MRSKIKQQDLYSTEVRNYVVWAKKFQCISQGNMRTNL